MRYEFFSLCSGQFWLYQTNQMDLAQHFSCNFLIQFVYQESFDGKLLLFIYISADVMQMFDLYIMYLFIKVNHITFKECRVSIIYMLYYNLQGKYDFINI